ncbi:MAG: Hsp20/alpha crystallin family protein [Stappiaceae bacterium]
MAETPAKLDVKRETKPVTASEESWSPFESLHREVDRLFSDFGRFDWRHPFHLSSPGRELGWPAQSAWRLVPEIDLIEEDEAYEITAELPGLKEDNIEIKLSNGMLTIRGEKKAEKEERKKDYHLSERRFGSFQRTFPIPEGVDVDAVEAVLSQGVLSVKIPKTAEARQKEKTISVKAA